jgi:hypothetical protein
MAYHRTSPEIMAYHGSISAIVSAVGAVATCSMRSVQNFEIITHRRAVAQLVRAPA